jgi:hypothetical protein
LAALSSEGRFFVRSDYGTFDLSVRPSQETGFAWLVQPSVEVTAPNQALPDDLQMTWPVVYEGTVNSSSVGRLPGALIRTYVYIGGDGEVVSDPADATSVLQVAETRADDEGRYQLLLPSRVGSQ